MKNLKKAKKAKIQGTSYRVYNFQKKSTNVQQEDLPSKKSGFKPIKNPVPKLYSIRWEIKEDRDRTFFVLQNNNGKNTDFYLIKHEDVNLNNHQKETVIDIARLLGWKKPLVATLSSKYNQAVDFLELNQGETLEGDNWEMIFSRISQLINIENHLQGQHDIAVEHHQHPERFVPKK